MKLHLPKMLLTAVLAAVFCVQQVQAADYSVYTSTAITDPETGEEVTPAYGYGIIQWTGGSTGTAGSGVSKDKGIFYPVFKKATYDADSKKLVVGDTYTGGYDDVYTKTNWHTIMLDDNNSAGENATVQYDAGGVKISGLVVTSDSNIDMLQANGSTRDITIGKAAGVTGYTTIAKDFTLDMDGSSLTLAGTQVWNVDENCTYTIKDAQNGSIASSADLTIGGAGTVSLESGLNNSGSLTVNGNLQIASTIANTGTLTFGENAKLIVSSLDALTEEVGEINYAAEISGAQQVGIGRQVFAGGGSVSGVTQVYIGSATGDTVTVINGLVGTSDTKTAYVIIDGDTVTIDAGSQPADFGTPDFFAVAGTLNIAAGLGDKTAGSVLSETVGDGMVNLNTDATMTSALGADFTGTINIATGKTLEMETVSMLGSASALVVGEGATLTLTNVTASNSSTALQGSGTVSLILQSPSGTENHNKGLQAANFNGVVEISKGSGNGNTDLVAQYTLGDSASFRLISGNHWSSSGKISRAIVLAGEAEDDFSFQHQGSLELAGKVTGSYLTAGVKYNSQEANNLTLSGAGSDIDCVKMKNGTLTVNADMAFGTVNAPTVTINAGKTLTIGRESTQTSSAINTLTLNGTLKLVSGASFTGSIKGSGKYDLGSSTALQGTLDSTWTGTVSLTGATLTDADLNAYGNANSTVELSSATGSLAAGTINTNVKLTSGTSGGDATPGMRVTETTGKTVTFAGSITSNGTNGNLVVEAPEERISGTDTYVFTGDVSGWTGKLIGASSVDVKYEGNATSVKNDLAASNGATVNVTYGGDKAVTVNGYVDKTPWSNASGTINIKVENTSAEGVTFTNTVEVTSTNLAAGTTAAFNGTSALGNLTLGAGAAITGTGSLTIGELILDLQTYTTDYSQTHTLVSTSGTLNFTGSLDAYQDVNVGNYTATVEQSGNSITLSFSEIVAPDTSITTTVTSFGSLTDGMLTLNVGADLTDATKVLISGISDDIMKQILGDANLPTDGMVGIKLTGANDSTFTATDDQMIGFQGNEGIYYGQQVGSAWQYQAAYIPEPTTATLSLLALMGLAARRRRKA